MLRLAIFQTSPMQVKARPQTDSHINPLGDEIEICIRQHEFERQARMIGPELGQERHNAELSKRDRSREPKGARQSGSSILRRRAGVLQLLDQRLDPLEVNSALFRRGQLTRRSLKQANTELVLQAGD
jgi:hypothetical protein